MNLHEIAKALGVAPSQFCEWRIGRTIPSTARLIALSLFLHVNPMDLMGYMGDELPIIDLHDDYTAHPDDPAYDEFDPKRQVVFA